jgi:hypothetical protein
VPAISKDLLHAFKASAESGSVVSARFAVLDAAAETFSTLAVLLHVSGYISREAKETAICILLKFAADLCSGMSMLFKTDNMYSAASLLRQLIEVEYLMFLGYKDPQELGRWLTANDEQRRKTFAPQQMRKAADGLFRDKEYWQHCEMGGHPHPKGRAILPSFTRQVSPVWFLLPDADQHVRRLWTSVRLLMPKLNLPYQTAIENCSISLSTAVDRWEEVEDPLLLSFDGIAS